MGKTTTKVGFVMRNYFLIEKTRDRVFLFVGKGIDVEEKYNDALYWHPPLLIESEDVLFDRIRELLNQ